MNNEIVKFEQSSLQLLGTLFLLLNKIRIEGLMSIESDIENPKDAPIFKAIDPYDFENEIVYTFMCDVLRMMTNGYLDAVDTQRYMEAYIKNTTLTEEQASLCECIKLTIIVNLKGYTPLLCIEHGRQGIPSKSKPSYQELEEFIRIVKNESEPTKEIIDATLVNFYTSIS